MNLSGGFFYALDSVIISPMKIYLAGSFARIDELRGYCRQLRTFDYIITSTWLFQPSHAQDDDWRNNRRRRQCAALEDLIGLADSDVMILFTEPPEAITSHGGAMVELGYAIALSKPLIIIGPAQNCFVDLGTHKTLLRLPEWDVAAVTAALGGI